MSDEFSGQYQSAKALCCPFCGKAPVLVPWHGGGPKKRNLMCRSEDCFVGPSVCGSTEAQAIERWNMRTSLAQGEKEGG